MSADGPDAPLLDEMFSQAIAAELAARGVDCRAVTADPVLRSLAALAIFETALAQTRVLVTNNVADFESLCRAREAAGGAVPGLIYTCDVAFPRTKAYVAWLAAALETAARDRQTARCGGVLWLRAADSLHVLPRGVTRHLDSADQCSQGAEQQQDQPDRAPSPGRDPARRPPRLAPDRGRPSRRPPPPRGIGVTCLTSVSGADLGPVSVNLAPVLSRYGWPFEYETGPKCLRINNTQVPALRLGPLGASQHRYE